MFVFVCLSKCVLVSEGSPRCVFFWQNRYNVCFIYFCLFQKKACMQVNPCHWLLKRMSLLSFRRILFPVIRAVSCAARWWNLTFEKHRETSFMRLKTWLSSKAHCIMCSSSSVKTDESRRDLSTAVGIASASPACRGSLPSVDLSIRRKHFLRFFADENDAFWWLKQSSAVFVCKEPWFMLMAHWTQGILT